MLEIFGLDGVQELAYLALLGRASATRAELCRLHPQVEPRDISAALRALEERGLISRRAQARSRYVAAPPDVAWLDWLREQTTVLHDAQATIGALGTRYRAVSRRTDPFALIEVTRGQQATDRWNNALAGASREVRAFEHPPFGTTPTWGMAGVMNPLELRQLGTGVSFRVVYDRAAIQARANLDELREGIEAGEQARVTGELPLRMALSDHQLGLLPLQRGQLLTDGLLTVRPCALLDALSELFEAIWHNALPLNLDQVAALDHDPDPGSGPPPDPSLTAIAGLLAAGLSDKAIARHMGISVRTVERHIQKLMTTLGAKTRYQAGVLASRRGWI